MKQRSFLDGLTYRSAVFARDGLMCSYCSKPLLPSEATLDHVEPQARGGRNHPNNMVVACATCNNRKGCLTLTEFLLGFAEKPQAAITMVGSVSVGARPAKRPHRSWRSPEMHRRTLELKEMYARIKEHHKGVRFHKPLFQPSLSSKLEELPAFRKLADLEIEPRRLAA